jgi:ligand-binding sensor domain-containing protein/signal transduction histidine kinase
MGPLYKTWILSLLLVLTICWHTNGQNENLRFEHIGYGEGLSSESPTAIIQDIKGYIWISTEGGLYKYDGYTYTKFKFDPSDPNSLSSNFIYTIWEDKKQGSIWLGTNDGLCKFDRYSEKFTRYKPDPKSKFADPNISAINEDRNGMMWVSNFAGLCRFDRQAGKFLPDSFDVSGTICKDKAGDFWIGGGGGLHQLFVQPDKPGKLSEVKIKHYQPNPANPDSLSDGNIGCVYEDKDGIIWLATMNGVNSFDKKRNKFRRYQHDPKNIHSISSNIIGSWFGEDFAEDQEGNLWIATNRGVNKLNKARTAFTRYIHDSTAAHSISSDLISSLLIDRSGILWVGTFKGKVNKANLIQKPFGQIQNIPGNNNSLNNNIVTAICEDSSGIVWVGTEGGGLNRWDKKTNKFTHYRHDPGNAKTLRSDVVYSILEDRDRQLWISNGEFLSKLDKQTGEFIHYNSVEKKLNNGDPRQIFGITEDHDGVIWLGADFRVINFDKKTGKFKYYYHNEADSTSICDYGAISIFADSRNNIWIGHSSKGTDRLNKRTGIITHYKNNPKDPASISANAVNSFYEDSKGNIWLATQGGGLCSFNYQTAKFTTYTDKDGLPDNAVFSILEDNKNHLWLGTANGLSQFDPLKEKITNYDETDGLVNRVFAAGERDRPPHYKGKDGTLYFGGSNGLIFFHPDQVKADSILAPVVITQFKLFDRLVKGVNETNEILLKHNENYFSFEFSSLSYANPGKNEYAYKLEGVDKDWVYSGSRHYTSYTNVGPGTYTFKVKATNSDGIWNEKGTSISIIINPPWWRTWLAYTLYGLLILAGVYAVYRYQRQKLIQREREKARARELAQAKEIEKAYTELKATQAQLIQSEKMASLGELTAGIAHEIQNPLNFVNNFSELNAELIEELKKEKSKSERDENLENELIKDIADNEQKIIHHGKRADAIVKGMLQHSRGSAGKKEPTDINALADEYLRLSYHGLRAKDKTFNATIHTDFDQGIGLINIIPEDIGRVLLNLYSNAFYAAPLSPEEGFKDPSYRHEPTIWVSTRKVGDKVLISVRDNGPGIPPKVLDKIFQPFFTTKPTGQGTGLGLSLSYDIVKAHGGEIKVETKEGQGSVFVIHLPSG